MGLESENPKGSKELIGMELVLVRTSRKGTLRRMRWESRKMARISNLGIREGLKGKGLAMKSRGNGMMLLKLSDLTEAPNTTCRLRRDKEET